MLAIYYCWLYITVGYILLLAIYYCWLYINVGYVGYILMLAIY